MEPAYGIPALGENGRGKKVEGTGTVEGEDTGRVENVDRLGVSVSILVVLSCFLAWLEKRIFTGKEISLSLEHVVYSVACF
jgi:hypothetical protein